MIDFTDSNNSNIINILKNEDNLGICIHYDPDGDSLGSLFALGAGLESLNKQFSLFAPTLPSEPYYSIFPISNVNISLPDNNFDYLIFIDCSNLKRVSPDINYSPKPKKAVINIDHHEDNTLFGDYNLISTSSGASGEIIYQILLNLNIKITQEIANYLYIAIITDTGKFSYPNTTSETLQIASELLKAGVKPEYINELIFEQESISKIRLLAKALDRLESKFDNQVIWTEVTQEMIKQTGVKEYDFDIILNKLRTIKNGKIFILFKEAENGIIKVSLRAKSGYKVNTIAHKFGGGGHICAAGCRFKKPLNEVKELLLSEVFKLFE